MLPGLSISLTYGICEHFSALVQSCWQCPHCTLYHHLDHSNNGQFLWADWGHTLYSVKLKNRAVWSLSFYYHTRLSGGTWKKNSNTGLCKKAIIPSGKQSQTKQVFWAQDKRAFQAGNCQHCFHPLVKQLLFPAPFYTMISNEAIS